MSRIPFPGHAWPLLRKALEHIASHPDEFYMRSWVMTAANANEYKRSRVEERTGMPYPACGTVACLAGRILLESGANPDEHRFYSGTALAALGLPVTDENGDWFATDDVGMTLDDVFEMTNIRTYAGLSAVLEERFSFPEPLPAVPAVTP